MDLGLGSCLLRHPEMAADLISSARQIAPRWISSAFDHTSARYLFGSNGDTCATEPTDLFESHKAGPDSSILPFRRCTNLGLAEDTGLPNKSIQCGSRARLIKHVIEKETRPFSISAKIRFGTGLGPRACGGSSEQVGPEKL
ncbi:unnamed protein product [Protopolystoma xenopodis]|uniref:Uncharacterized protein n=1 Tax=Protopolystoma xenopodis TaxID=117903 RepID=A0A448WXX4_9PLAT|nr:unnamed protein product [Protopolystoma xenopodis]